MEAWQKQILLENRSYLIEYIRCGPLFIAKLRSKDSISLEDNEALNAENNRLKQTDYLLEVIVTKKNGYKELINALQETTQTGARDILLVGVLCNLMIKISSRITILTEYFTEQEIKQFYSQLSSLQFEEVYSCVIQFLDTDQPFQVLKETIPQQIPYYIERILCKRLRLKPEIFRQSCDDIFVVSKIRRKIIENLAGQNKIAYSCDQLDEITAQLIILVNNDMGDWCEIQQLNAGKSPMHLIEYEDGKNIFILKESLGSSKIIRRFLETNKADHDITIAEDQFMWEIEKEKWKGVCICDLPGMGKTILIENLARKADQSTKNIVAFVRLQHFMQTVFKCSQSEISKEVLMKYLSTSNSVLSVSIMKKVMEMKNTNIDVFFDGFDEIEEKYLDKTTMFLKSLTFETNFRIFVTSRPHMRDKLQDTLAVIAYDILPFKHANQIDFLTNFWLNKCPDLKNLKNKLKQFANLCLEEFNENILHDERDIAGIPLMCLLVAEIYAKHANRYVRKDIDLKKSGFLFGKSMFDIYKAYIDTKFKVQKSSSRSLNEVTKMKEEHYRKALMQIFPTCAKKVMENIHDSEESLQRSHKSVLSYGLVHELYYGDEIICQFIHRTIAEFLIADYIVSQLAILNEKDRTGASLTINATKKGINDFVVFLFENVFTAQKVYNYKYLVVHFTKAIMPKDYFYRFTFSTVLYFMEHRLQHETLPKGLGNIISHYLNSTNRHINLAHLIECCGYHRLLNVFDLIEIVVQGSSTIELISQESLCESMVVVIQYSNTQFVKKCVEFVFSYFSFSLNEIFQVCRKNHSLTPLQIACLRGSYDLLDYFLAQTCSTENQCLVHFCVNFGDIRENPQICIDIIERLLSINSSLLTEKDIQDAIPLFYSVTSWQLMKFLIEKGSDTSTINTYGNTVAHEFSFAHNIIWPAERNKIMTLLLEDSKAIQIFKVKINEGNTPIHEALRVWNDLPTSLLEAMLNKSQINVNEEDGNGDTLLSVAYLGNQSVQNLNLLVELGAIEHKSSLLKRATSLEKMETVWL